MDKMKPLGFIKVNTTKKIHQCNMINNQDYSYGQTICGIKWTNDKVLFSQEKPIGLPQDYCQRCFKVAIVNGKPFGVWEDTPSPSPQMICPIAVDKTRACGTPQCPHYTKHEEIISRIAGSSCCKRVTPHCPACIPYVEPSPQISLNSPTHTTEVFGNRFSHPEPMPQQYIAHCYSNEALAAHDQQVRKDFAEESKQKRPKIVCLCGSTRFGDAFQKAQLYETLGGNIVLSIGCNMKSDIELFGHLSESELQSIKTQLDVLHKRKIDLADEVLILNVGGYIGDSTRSELKYAKKQNKTIRYLEDEYCENQTHEDIGQYKIYCQDCMVAHLRAIGEKR